eukprot:COSAG05_NODE_591_length_8495_cov_3436.543116_5_plen_85_part_00
MLVVHARALTHALGRSLKSGKVVVMLQGRHAGKKAVIVRQVSQDALPPDCAAATADECFLGSMMKGMGTGITGTASLRELTGTL